MSKPPLRICLALSITLAAATQARIKAEFLCELIENNIARYNKQTQNRDEIDFTKLFALSDDEIDSIILYESTLKDATINCNCPVCMNNQPTTGHKILNEDYLDLSLIHI